MFKLTLLAITVFCLQACTPRVKQVNVISVSTDERFTKLGVPLASEEGEIKLVILTHLSQKILKGSQIIFFVPLSDDEIQATRSRFALDKLRPAIRAEYVRNIGMRDKITKEPGTLLAVGTVHINGNEAKVGGGYTRFTVVSYSFFLSRENGQWQVREVSFPLS